MKPTQEKVIAWARDAGLPKWYQTDGIVNEGLVVKFANIAYEAGRKDEREACAKLMDEMAVKDKLTNYYKVAANAIRARGQYD